MKPSELLKGYDSNNLTTGVLGGHSALDVCHGAKVHHVLAFGQNIRYHNSIPPVGNCGSQAPEGLGFFYALR